MAEILDFRTYAEKLYTRQMKIISATGERNDKLYKRALKLNQWERVLLKKNVKRGW